MVQLLKMLMKPIKHIQATAELESIQESIQVGLVA